MKKTTKSILERYIGNLKKNKPQIKYENRNVNISDYHNFLNWKNKNIYDNNLKTEEERTKNMEKVIFICMYKSK